MGTFLSHELRTGHSILSAVETMFGADEQTHNLIYGLDIAATTVDVTSLVAGGVAAVTVSYKAIRYGLPAIIRGGTKFAKYLTRLVKKANGGKVVALELEPHFGQYADAVDYTFFTNGSKELDKWKAAFNKVTNGQLSHGPGSAPPRGSRFRLNLRYRSPHT